MDPDASAAPGTILWLPRMGGDGPKSDYDADQAERAPPHGRGWTRIHAGTKNTNTGSPAWAGMDPTNGTTSTTIAGLPRMGGDGPERAASNWFL